MRLVFCGTGEIGVPSLQYLLGDPSHEVLAVVTQPDKPAGRDLKPRASAVKLLAEAHGVTVFQPPKLRDPAAMEVLRGLQPDLLVVMAYGQILSRAVLDWPRLGCLNLHASILPRHRGASPIQAALLAGDPETGIAVMWMNEGLDTGDVLLVEKIDILPHDTAGSLHDRLAAVAPVALRSALNLIVRGEAPRIPQDPALATHAPKLRKSEGWIDWTLPSGELALRVRAMSPWPGAFGRLQGRVLKIHAARAVEGSGVPGCILRTDADGFVIACGSGALQILELQAEGRRRMTARDFLCGAGIAQGDAFDLSFLPVG